MATQPDRSGSGIPPVSAEAGRAEAPPASPVALRMGAIVRLAGELGGERFPRGDLADLRRLVPESPDAPAFWRLLFELVPETERRGETRESRWALVLHGLALTTQPGLAAHRQGARIGGVLAEQGFSTLRLNRLLRARGPAFRDQAPRACRFLAARGAVIDWARFGLLLLAPDQSDEQEHYRREIARDYFRALHSAARAATTLA